MYFPKSQIQTNLYTNGNEYVLATTKKEYVGYYFETSNGFKYTGKTPQDTPNTRLISLNLLAQTFTFDSENQQTPPLQIVSFEEENYIPDTVYIRSLPVSNPTTPTSKDQSLGVFTRYFCKKRNELKYLEIDKATYTKLFTQDKTIAWDLYAPEKTLWYIKGDKEQIYKANKGLISLIEQQQKWYGFTQFFQDKFLKYYLES
jgi:hypothetical protein